MAGLRLVALLLLLLGLYAGWELIHGQDPAAHVAQVLDLFTHGHTQSSPKSSASSSAAYQAGSVAGQAAQATGTALGAAGGPLAILGGLWQGLQRVFG